MNIKIKNTDFTNMWWCNGWRKEKPDEKRIMCLQSGTYAATFDTKKAGLINFGILKKPMSAINAVKAKNDVVLNLPEADITWKIGSKDNIYTCIGSKGRKYDKEHLENLKLPLSLVSDQIPREQTRIIESGRFLQRFDMQNLLFNNKSGETLGVDARVEVNLLPDYMSITLEVTSNVSIGDIYILADIKLSPSWNKFVEYNNLENIKCLSVMDFEKNGVTLSTPKNDEVRYEYERLDGEIRLKSNISNLKAKDKKRLTFYLMPNKKKDENMIDKHIHSVNVDDIKIKEISPNNKEISASYIEERGIYNIPLPDLLDYWDMENNRDIIERVKIQITNPKDIDVRIPIVVAKDKEFAGRTGITPIIRDKDGIPTGLPVQISKNWHQTKGKTFLYQGPWFHGNTIVDVEANQTIEFELTIIYANWGKVPAASHAQLCLIGYGVNQLWDQVAIGSYGESICYDPDVNLGRSMIDDVRPLMVSSMRGGKWNWTNNVGGGDFLVYFNEKNEKQYLSRMKTYYKQYGPNLTEVHYSGVSRDNKISAHIKVSSPRCDDINRAYHSFRYDINEKTEFTRLAFYQLGADGYNNHQFNRMAYGNQDGLIKEWEPKKGGLEYETKDIKCKGNQIWFSLHDAIAGLHYNGRKVPHEGAWANRGIIIRYWEAKLGGVLIENPYANVYLTQDHVGSSNVEISPPSDIKSLLPGDYIECEIEYVVIPMHAKDYYGPNKLLENSLIKKANTWKPVYRQAVGNNIDVKLNMGKLIKKYPIIISVENLECIEFEVEGGISYVPVTFIGMSYYKGWVLKKYVNGEWININGEMHGDNFYQTEYNQDKGNWNRTYNILLEGYEDKKKVNKFKFELLK